MNTPNYISHTGNGNCIINLETVPDRAFLKCSMERDICKMRIISRKEKSNMEAGSNDIMIVSLSGDRKIISRKELVSNYKFFNGAPIKMAWLKENKTYTIIENKRKDCRVLIIPNNCIGIYNGAKIYGGSYVVANMDSEGNVNKSSLKSMDSKSFRKMYRVPMQDALRNLGNKPSSNRFTLYDNKGNNPFRNNSTVINTNIKPTLERRKEVKPVEKPIVNTMVSKPTQKTQQVARPQVQQNNNKYAFTAVAILTDVNGRSVGYLLEDINTHQRKECILRDVIILLENHKIDNLMVVNKEVNGTLKKIIRGNGISREALPKVIYTGN